jgi:hypothetical protein
MPTNKDSSWSQEKIRTVYKLKKQKHIAKQRTIYH